MAKIATKKNSDNDTKALEQAEKVATKVSSTKLTNSKLTNSKPITSKVIVKAENNPKDDKKATKPTKTTKIAKVESNNEPVELSKKTAKVTKPKAIPEVKTDLKSEAKTDLKTDVIKKAPVKKVNAVKPPVIKEVASKEVTSKEVTSKEVNTKVSNTLEQKPIDIDNRPSASKQKAEALAKANAETNLDSKLESKSGVSVQTTSDVNVNSSNQNNSIAKGTIPNNQNSVNRPNLNRPDNRIDNRPDNRIDNRNNPNNRFNPSPNSKYPNNRDNQRDNRPDNRIDNRNNQVPPRKISNENPNYQTSGLDTKYGGKPNLNAPKTNPVLTKYDTRRPPERAPRFKNPNQVAKPAPKPFQDFNSPISSLDTNDLKRLQEIEFKNKLRNDEGATPIDGNRKLNNPIPPRKNSNPNSNLNNLNNNTNRNLNNKQTNKSNILNKTLNNSTSNNSNNPKNKTVLNDNIIDDGKILSETNEENNLINLVEQDILTLDKGLIGNNINENNIEILVSEDVETELENKIKTGDINIEQEESEVGQPEDISAVVLSDDDFVPLNVKLITNEENQVVVDLNDELENIQKTIREVKKSTFNEKNKLRLEQGLPPLKINNNKNNPQNRQSQFDVDNEVTNNLADLKSNNTKSINDLDNNLINDVNTENSNEFDMVKTNEKNKPHQNSKHLPKHISKIIEKNKGIEQVDIPENSNSKENEVDINDKHNNDKNINSNSNSKEFKKPLNQNKPLHQNQKGNTNPNQAGINKANLNNPNNPNSIIRQQNEAKQANGNGNGNGTVNANNVPANNVPTNNPVTNGGNQAKVNVVNNQANAQNTNVTPEVKLLAAHQNKVPNDKVPNDRVSNDRNQQQKDFNRDLEKAVPKKEHLPKPKPIKVTERKMTDAEFKDPFFKKILDNTYRFLRHKLNVEEGTTILVTVSGGVDSVVMLDILYNLTSRYRIGLEIAHYNHNLRGQASIDDEKFVRGLADFYALQYHFANGNVKEHSEKNSLSIETAARGLRYKFFEKVVNAIKCSYVATAHNANDLAETFLLNLTRGSGLTGLSGIPLKRPLTKTSSVIRPIIELKKAEIIEYANRRNLEWREDHTNAETAFTRNKIRHVVLPLLEQEFNPAIIDVINRTAKLLGGADRFLNRFVNDNTNKVISEINEHTVKINIGLLKTYNHFVQGEIIQNILVNTFDMQNLNLNLIDRLIDLIRADINSKIELTKELKAYRDRDEIIISNKIETQAIDVMINRTVNADYDLGTHIFSIKQVTPEEVDYDAENHIEYFDAQFMPQFLNLRAWKDGDSFKPIGMNGNSMKVSDLLTNEKVSAQSKREILVLTDKVNIIWVVGYRLSEDYKVKPSSKTILKVEIINKETNKEVIK